MKKLKYLKPLTDPSKIHHGCLNCGGTETILSLKTRLYNGFGGWNITKNGKEVYCAKVNIPWRKNKTLRQIETLAKKEPNEDWRAIMDLPLRSAEYQRQGDNKWVLVKSGNGFA